MSTVKSRRRRRRTAEEAHREILAVAQRRLAAGGPEAIRLQDIAADVGISHPAVLHHFGSREGLLRSLARSALTSLNADILRAISDPAASTTAAQILDRIYDTLGDSGHARLMAWLALSGYPLPPRDEDEHLLRALADALFARIAEGARLAGGTPPRREEIDFTVRLVAVAMMGDAIFGAVVSRSAAQPEGPDLQHRFRAWFGEVLSERLLGAERPRARPPKRKARPARPAAKRLAGRARNSVR